MKLLVIGSGGREHAMVWKLAQSPKVSRLWCAPGNAGISGERIQSNQEPVQCVPIAAEALPELLEFARDQRPDLTVVGPDNPLAMGIVDLFQEAGFPIWGPNRKAARFESSKAFSQDFMQRHAVPTMRAGLFSEASAANRFAAELGGRCAVKADGLALGKGVILCDNLPKANAAIHEILVEKRFGSAGANIVIQELLEGAEVSLHALCDGRTTRLFPTAQDHKRVFDGDAGPNTGGMGAYSPIPFLSDTEVERLGRSVLDPWLLGCQADGIDYRGILYPGLMLTAHGPRVLEFNARFGDPETQVFLTRLENDLVDLLLACVTGTLDRVNLRWRPGAAVCVVVSSAGYPGAITKGHRIHGLEIAAQLPNTKVFHAGTAKDGNHVVTSGGRVLGATAWAGTLADARAAAYSAVECIRFDGAHYRRDIAAKGLK